MRRVPFVCAVLLAACGGNWSNQDIEFVNALPAKADLASKLPVDGSQSGLGGEPSKAYTDTRKASNDFNGLLDRILGLAELVRQVPPTRREANRRTWGPFPDEKHPGVEARIVMTKIDEETFLFVIEARPQTQSAWTALLTGNLRSAAQLTKGRGHIELSFRAGRSIGIDDPQSAALDTLEIDYLTDLNPLRVEMLFTFASGNEQNLSSVGYTYRENADRSGSIRFQGKGTHPDVLEMLVTSKWLSSGAGRADVEVLQGNFAGATAVECWDTAFNVTHAYQSWPGGVEVGLASDCVTVAGL
ncbi:MAG: hypothetical protein ACOZIN_14885 [Myxococcota bacterium]